MPSIRDAIRKQFKQPSPQELIVETLIRRAQSKVPPSTGRDMAELFAVNAVIQPGEAVVAQGYSGRGGGLTLTLDWGALVCPGFVEGTVSAGASRSAGRQMMIALLRQPGIDHTPDEPVCFVVGTGQFTQWTVKVGATVGLKAEVSLNAATGDSTMMTTEAQSDAATKAAEDKYGTVGAPSLGLLGLKASASAVAEAGLSYDGEWVFTRDFSPRWYTSARCTKLHEDLQGWISIGGTRAGLKERIKSFFESNKATIGVLAPRLSKLQTLQRLITGGKIPMSMYENALVELAAFLSWLDLTLGGDTTELKRDLDRLKKQVEAEASRNWVSRRFYKADKRAVKSEVVNFLKDVGSDFNAEEGRSGYASLDAINKRLETLNQALTLSKPTVKELREISARYSAQVTAHSLEPDAEEANPQNATEESHPATTVPNNLTFISLVGHKGGASAGIKLQATASADAPGLGSKVGASAGAGINHSRKFTDYRIQHYATHKSGGKDIVTVFTQDTHVVMMQSKLEASAKVDAVFFGKDLTSTRKKSFRSATDRSTDSGTFQRKKEHSIVNTMTYRSAYAAWHPPKSSQTKTRSLSGTGFSIGTSLPIEVFVKLAGGEQDVEALRLLSETLSVHPARLWDTFRKLDYLADLDNAENGAPSAILMESTFCTSPLDLDIKWSGAEPQLTTAALTAILTSKNPKLQALRVRYRAVDTYNEGVAANFKLGIPKTKMGLTFELKSIREANISGIIELGTFWMGDWDTNNRRAHVPENLVVPPVLIHQ